MDKRGHIEQGACKIHFLDWHSPCLELAADFVLRMRRTRSPFDLRDLTLVLPVSRAARRLTEILLERAAASNAALVPPGIVTVGGLPEQMYASPAAVASELQAQMTWLQALQTFDRAALRSIFGSVPDDADTVAWLKLARCMTALWQELSGACLDFAEVPVLACERFSSFSEPARWEALAEIHESYLRLLDSQGLADRQVVRIEALEGTIAPRTRELVVIACADLNPLMRKFMTKAGDALTVLVHAPESLRSRFDEVGCLRPEAWQDSRLEIDESQIVFTKSARDQVLACVAFLNGLGGPACDDVTIGVGDTARTGAFVRQLRAAGVAARDASGVPLTRLSPLRLLQQTLKYLQTKRYTEFASLCRHPDLRRWLARRLAEAEGRGVEDFLIGLDKYYDRHLPCELIPGWPVSEDRARGATIERMQEAFEEALGALTAARLPLNEWAAPVMKFLAEVYGDSRIHRREAHGRDVLGAITAIRESLSELTQLHGDCVPELSGSQALEVLLAQLKEAKLAPEGGVPEVEVLGWLELHLDDAPNLAVTGMTEGSVPEFLNADPFFPDTMRSALGLLDNRRRYARDAYALSAMLASRRRVILMASQTDGDGAAQMPSRLLMACGDLKLAERTRRFYSDELPEFYMLERRHADKNRLELPPPPRRLDRVDRITATSLKDYLACPYRYYLRHRLGLDRIDDEEREMDGGNFGSFVHEVLRRLNTGKLADSSDERTVREFLWDETAKLAADRFGRLAQPAVELQLISLRDRFACFAKCHAANAAEGWRIKAAEYTVELDGIPDIFPEARRASIEAGAETRLVARIDRIETNSALGEMRVVDYKSADTAVRPENAHRERSSGNWVDLQLPLYYQLLRLQGVEERIELGYIQLPKSGASQWAAAEWDSALLEESRAVIDATLARIIRQEFWPPSEGTAFDPFAGICGPIVGESGLSSLEEED